MNRREFTLGMSLASMASILGIEIVYGGLMPEGYRPLGLQDPDPFKMFHKDKEMVVLNDRPWNMEAKAHLLNDRVTPNQYMFIRNNGNIPEGIDVSKWTLTIDGESVKNKKTYSLSELKSKFGHHTYQLALECGGNGRSEFNPPAKGNQWTVGAISCAEWTGVRLRDVLEDVGITSDAVYIGYHAADTHLSGDPKKEPISRGVPIAKALQDETLLAFAMNGEDIPLAHGHPLRLVCGGWPASTSGKWLNRISVRNKEHDGEKMGGSSYRVPCETVAPGSEVDDANMCIIESMPVKSLITFPKSGALIKNGKSLTINGHAWAGELEVSKMEYSIDFGSTWHQCSLEKPVNRLAWQHFKASISFPKKGYYEVWAKATDSNGKAQPLVLPGWNPKGYLNNACHRIAVKIV
ncbi:molybdopterin containing oxidoreductase [Flagellimonas taeanensis]|uniref:Mo-co oxidoreductase dimerisation domain-containing protein n=1 Tax=Flagellimonas taeanensis TaxID=1005926 RepID=A0A1M6Y6U1_9FLAO|nr:MULTISPECIES: molybdopterin-dependent oxidoreductase [Allomuricauda]MDC6383837.1 molybdopterin-dependent oxidoreductase [Muricauda sp. SK9]RIV48460.1 molybdopterin containing oxidoreductase [Allomuricauda taeanensis]SFC06025.1 Mo-co oxidoreductase dimerisation domain-containing protein [Allomuricauda taeanensis]SHL13882.1 sulfite dehydrogenase (cytochrome) subunit SorA apoprotein [Allomuricauda taeanensis]